MGILKRAISADASAISMVLDATDIVGEIEKIHKTSAVATAALGRLSIAASLMGYSLKNENDSVTMRIDADGPLGQLVAVADSKGNVKSCVNRLLKYRLTVQASLMSAVQSVKTVHYQSLKTLD